MSLFRSVLASFINMKFSFSILSLAVVSLVGAGPVDRRAVYTANEYLEDGCAATILLFARGTTQLGNLVSCCPY